jgi:hypothetical protein
MGAAMDDFEPRLTQPQLARKDGGSDFYFHGFIVNMPGVILLGLGALAAITLTVFVSLFSQDEKVLITSGVWGTSGFLTLGDVQHRWRHHRSRGWYRFVSPTAGGSLFFIPIWVLFGALPFGAGVLVGLCRYFGVM